MPKVSVEDHQAVRVISLNRPEVHNCVDAEAAELLARIIEQFASDEGSRVLVVTGTGDKSFCSGADLKAAGELLNHAAADAAGPMGFARLNPGKPTIAAINGYCFAGGMELAAWCDFRIASSNATFGALNRRFGVPFIDGGTQRLPRILGISNAAYVILSGVRFDAKRALELGFVQEVVATGKALERALELAARIAEYPQASVLGDRRALLDGSSLPLDEGLLLERKIGMAAIEDPELAKGLQRFESGDRPDPPS